MIRVEAVLDREGLLRSAAVQGHAGAGPAGGDIVCAAVSVLARTLLRVLSNRKGITVRGEAPERGVFALEAEATSEKEFLAAAGAFFIEGVNSVCEEYPGYCSITIRRNCYGS